MLVPRGGFYMALYVYESKFKFLKMIIKHFGWKIYYNREYCIKKTQTFHLIQTHIILKYLLKI